MKKQYLTVLFTLTCVFGLGLGARAQEQDTVVTNVPFDFVAGGQVLPAGTYRVSRVDSTSGSRALEISSYETHASVFVIPTIFDDVQSDKAQVNFEHLGDKYFVTVQVPTCLVLDKSGPISKAMVDECENWATNCRHRWPC